jgi:hypothetical protein
LLVRRKMSDTWEGLKQGAARCNAPTLFDHLTTEVDDQNTSGDFQREYLRRAAPSRDRAAKRTCICHVPAHVTRKPCTCGEKLTQQARSKSRQGSKSEKANHVRDAQRAQIFTAINRLGNVSCNSSSQRQVCMLSVADFVPAASPTNKSKSGTKPDPRGDSASAPPKERKEGGAISGNTGRGRQSCYNRQGRG